MQINSRDPMQLKTHSECLPSAAEQLFYKEKYKVHFWLGQPILKCHVILSAKNHIYFWCWELTRAFSVWHGSQACVAFQPITCMGCEWTFTSLDESKFVVLRKKRIWKYVNHLNGSMGRCAHLQIGNEVIVC